jgi:uncharacterized protein (DUF1499 family)
MRRLLLLTLLVASPAMAALFGDLFAGTAPATLGVRDGMLAPCPASPNCVCSDHPDSAHQVAPIAFTGDPDAAFARLADIVAVEAGARIVTRRADYLHAQFQSRVLGFVDDVEFRLDRQGSTIAIRSASRLGYSDFGVNRDRVERIRAAFAAAGSARP